MQWRLRLGAFLVLLCGWAIGSRAQYVNLPIVQHRNYPTLEVSSEYYGLVTDTLGFVYFSLRNGIYRFDGQQPQKVADCDSVAVLATDQHRNRIYVGGKDKFGYLSPVAGGSFEFISLSKILKGGDRVFDCITKIEFSNKQIFFYSPRRIFVFDKYTHKLVQTLRTTLQHPFSGIFRNSDTTFIQIKEKGILHLTYSGLVELPNIHLPEGIQFYLPLSAHETLIGFSHEVVRYAHGKVTPFGDTKKMRRCVWQNAAQIGTRLVFGTTEQGCYFFDKETGTLLDSLNSFKRLPADAIQQLTVDKQNRLFLLHPFHFSWAYPALPLEQYTGFYGWAYQTLHFNKRLYTATGDGLFYLDKQKQLTSENYRLQLQNKQLTNRLSQNLNARLRHSQHQIPELLKKHNEIQTALYELEASLLDRKGTQVAEEIHFQISALQADLKSLERKINQRRRLEQRLEESEQAANNLQNANHLLAGNLSQRLDFIRVPGFPNKKCLELVNIKDKILLVRTADAVYSIRPDGFIQPVTNYFATALYCSQKYPNRIYVAEIDHLHIYELQGINLVWRKSLEEFHFTLNTLAEDTNGNLWLGTDEGVKLLTFITEKDFSHHIQSQGQYNFKKNKVFSHQNTLLILGENDIYFGYKSLPKLNTTLGKYINKTQPLLYIKQDTLYTLKQQRCYRILLPTLQVIDSMDIGQYLQGTQNIYVDEKGRAYFAGHEKLFSYIPFDTKPNAKDYTYRFKTYLLNARVIRKPYFWQATETFALHHFLAKKYLPYGNYTIKFNFASPNFETNSPLTYEYRLDNQDEWKTVSSNYLEITVNEGDYDLQIRALDANGVISAPAVYHFSIAPPFWKQWYAYLIYGGLLIGGVMAVMTVVNMRIRRLNQMRTYLELQVHERTAELKDKTLALEESNSELERQKREAEEANALLYSKNKEIHETNLALQKQKEELAKSKYLVEQQKEILEITNNELKESLNIIENQRVELAQAEKKAALSEITPIVAHEINTPLSAVKGSIANLFTAYPRVLDLMEHRYPLLTEAEKKIFHELLAVALKPQAPRTAREERKLCQTMEMKLEAAGIENAEEVADKIVKAGLQDAAPLYFERWQTQSPLPVLNLLYQTTTVIRQLSTMEQATEKALQVITALRNFIHQRPNLDEVIEFSLVESIEQVLRLYEYHTNGRNIAVQVEAENNVHILGFPERLQEVWVNLLMNAIHAIEKDGTITIKIQEQPGQVIVSFTDTGCGIPPEIIDKIFAELYTTKPRGIGTGLGLSIVKSAIEKHKGIIRVNSQPGQTTFTLFLPKQAQL